MILHLVCFKYKSSVDAQARDDHRAQLRTLKGLDGVVDLKVGEDVVRSAVELVEGTINELDAEHG